MHAQPRSVLGRRRRGTARIRWRERRRRERRRRRLPRLGWWTGGWRRCLCKVQLGSTVASILDGGLRRRATDGVFLQTVATHLVTPERARPAVLRDNMCHKVVDAVSIEVGAHNLGGHGQHVPGVQVVASHGLDRCGGGAVTGSGVVRVVDGPLTLSGNDGFYLSRSSPGDQVAERHGVAADALSHVGGGPLRREDAVGHHVRCATNVDPS